MGADSVLEEVIVTARKRAESLQNVPMAVSALTGVQLHTAGIDNLQDIQGRVPGLSINIFSLAEPDITMRGIGSDIESAGASKAIGVFIDGVYLSRGGGITSDLFDLERLEVLRGPQGTLYGKNVVGGAISFITNKPTRDFDAMAQTTVGTYNQTDTRGFASGPVTDNLAARLAFSSRSRDGYAHNLFTGHDMEDLNSNSLRGHLLWTPTDTVQVTLSGDRYRSRSTGQWRDITHAAAGNAAFANANHRRGSNNDDGRQDANIKGVSLRVDWSSGAVTFTSLTAYRRTDLLFFENSAGGFVDLVALNKAFTGTFSPYGFPDVDPSIFNPNDFIDDYYPQHKDESDHEISQEFRAGFDVTDKLSVLVGLYYLRENIRRQEFTDFYFHLREDGYNGPADVFTGQYTDDSYADNDSYAAYTQVIWNFVDAWSLTVGMRYSYDHKQFKETNRGQPLSGNAPVNFTARAHHSWDSFTPSVTLNFKPTDELMFYATYSTGYKAGGWNGESAETAAAAAQIFKPEHAYNLELGMKSQWWQHRAQLNIAAFHAQYKDQQSQQLKGQTSSGIPQYVIVNGDAQADGVEVEFVLEPLQGLTFSGSYACLDSRFIDHILIDSDDLKNNDTARSPHHSVNFTTAYGWYAGRFGQANIRVNYRYQSTLFSENNNNSLTRVAAQHTWDASVALTSPDRKWQLQLWGKNLTDEYNVASASEFLGTTFVGYQPPRTWGATVTWHY